MQRRTKGLVVMLGGLLLPGLALAQQESEALPGMTPASGYVGLSSSCALFEGEWWNAGDERALPIRGACGVPEQAVAVLLEVRSQSLGGESPQVKVWPGDGLAPAQGVLEPELGAAGRERQATAVVNLCASLPCEDLRMRSSATAYLDARVAGYFQPLSMSLSGGDAEESTATGSGTLLGSSGELLLEPLFTESANNNFFGVGAGDQMTTGFRNNFFGAAAGNLTTSGQRNNFFGASAGRSNNDGSFNNFFGDEAGRDNTTGAFNSFFGDFTGTVNTTGNWNSFFGADVGNANTTGQYNSFLGVSSGTANTTGSTNVFIGRSAGASNTVENNNTFVGGLANGFAGITNATALGNRAQVTQSNSLVLGSVAGENGAGASVNVGIGVSAPERQLHIRGPNAQVRIDRPMDATSFQLVRTTAGGDVLKSFVFGVLASGPDNGSFFIRDNAQNTTGATDRLRMRIDNAGNTFFQGTVSAVAFNSTSASRFKTDVTTLSDASASLQQLRGVRFQWKESGAPSLGLIAEEVAEVFPELVQFDAETGAAEAVNYAALVAVLIEGYKDQQQQLAVQNAEIRGYEARVGELEQLQTVQQGQLATQGEQLATQREQLAELSTLRQQVAAIERLLAGDLPALTQR